MGHSWLHHFSGEANTTKKIRNSAFLIVLESDKLGDIEAFCRKALLIIDIPRN
jgi:hypothetical protein